MASKEYVSAKMIDIHGNEIIVDGYVVFHEDRHYGADADGNRGVYRCWVDDVIDVGAYDPLTDDDVKLGDDDLEFAKCLLADTFLDQ